MDHWLFYAVHHIEHLAEDIHTRIYYIHNKYVQILNIENWGGKNVLKFHSLNGLPSKNYKSKVNRKSFAISFKLKFWIIIELTT